MGLSRRAPKNDDDRTRPLSEAAFSILQERGREWEGERSSSVVDLRVFGDAGDDIRKVLDRPSVRAAIEDGRRHRLQHRLRDTCATTLLDAGVAYPFFRFAPRVRLSLLDRS